MDRNRRLIGPAATGSEVTWMQEIAHQLLEGYPEVDGQGFLGALAGGDVEEVREAFPPFRHELERAIRSGPEQDWSAAMEELEQLSERVEGYRPDR